MSAPRDPVSPRSVLARVRDLGGFPLDRADLGLATPSLAELLRHTRRDLLAYARVVGLTGIHHLTKAVLAARVRREVARLVAVAGEQEPADVPHKFDLGLAHAETGGREDIPWGYGQDRVTAMAVDPESLYVYWEVTDGALERARAGLGPEGRNASLHLRVYDVTSRIFDGTNAHHYFDHAISRTDRQWFFFIGRPSSTVVVEVGLKSQEGYFVRIARSGRTDFPRREPLSGGSVEWLTVHSARGEPGEPVSEGRPIPAVIADDVGPRAQPEFARVWDIRRTHGEPDGGWISRDESFGPAWAEWGEWTLERTIEWEGPLIRTAWEAGPFAYPIEPARYVEERFDGPVTVHSVDGRTRIVHGARQIVIRGLSARAERRVLAVWEAHHSWVARSGVAVRVLDAAASTPGGSERVALGASELRWLAASELRLGGASELYRLGASELRYLGASEWLFAGASEWRPKGASELRYLGASERRERGASEIRYAGASERLHVGASERVAAGASENRARYPAERTNSAPPRG